MAARYVRIRNANPDRFALPMRSTSSRARGIINEAAFRLFAKARSEGLQVRELGGSPVSESVAAAAAFVHRFRAHDRAEVPVPEGHELAEVEVLAKRLESFLADEPHVIVWPHFPGCGWLDAAEGDAMSREILYEVKAGDSGFKGQDIRQVLCYAALAKAGGLPVPQSACIVNPRRGVALSDTLDDLCMDVAGMPVGDMLDAIIAYISEPQWEERF